MYILMSLSLSLFLFFSLSLSLSFSVNVCIYIHISIFTPQFGQTALIETSRNGHVSATGKLTVHNAKMNLQDQVEKRRGCVFM